MNDIHQMELLVDFPQTPRTRRSVSFSDRVNVNFVEDLSREYKDDLWFSRHEMDMFKYRVTFLMKKIASNDMTMVQYAERNVNNTGAFMGLEMHLTKSVVGLIKHRRRVVWRAVLTEHGRQREAGVFDPDDMKLALEATTGESFRRARVIAMLHAADDSDER